MSNMKPLDSKKPNKEDFYIGQTIRWGADKGKVLAISKAKKKLRLEIKLSDGTIKLSEFDVREDLYKQYEEAMDDSNGNSKLE